MARAIAKLLVLLPFFGGLSQADAPPVETPAPGCALGAGYGPSPFDEEEPDEQLVPEPDEANPDDRDGDGEPDQSSFPADPDEAEEVAQA